MNYMRQGSEERRAFAREVIDLYTSGHSIRQIAVHMDVSYGLVHNVLIENQVKLRSRGGPNRWKNRQSK